MQYSDINHANLELRNLHSLNCEIDRGGEVSPLVHSQVFLIAVKWL